LPHQAAARTLDEILARSEQLADEFESYEPRPGDDSTASPVTAVRLAAFRRAEAERALADAIAVARQREVIGQLVGTSGEAARQRYGKHVAG
jgi:hypothetical protein